MLIDPILISVDPLMNLKRKAIFITLDDSGIDSLVISYRIQFYDEQDEVIENNRIRGYYISLRADNTTPVDSNGMYVLDENGNFDWNNPNAIMGEYDFIKMAIQAGANVRDMITGGAQRADMFKKFDV